MQFCKTYNLANGNVIGTFAILLGMALLSSMPVRAAEVDALAFNKELPAITMIPGDGMNLEIDEVLNPYYVILKLTSPVHNFFYGRINHLITSGETTTIGLSLAGNDAGGNLADVKKWVNLAPLISYADPSLFESYLSYEKDTEGRWVSSDPLARGDGRYAGTGDVPQQTVIPNDIAKMFLSKDGHYWQPWRETTGEAVTELNIFRIKEAFVLPTAAVSLRIPYTYTYLQAFIERLQTAKLPGVFVDELGTTPEGRKLQVIRLEDPALLQQPSDHPTICLIAREHASEQASSWALSGALNTLLTESAQAEKLRRGRTWLFIPIQDPDGSAHSTFDQLTERFYRSKNPPTPSEVLSYARYFTDYIASGQSIDTVISLHNVEANECSNVFSPFRNIAFQDEIIQFNKKFFARLEQEGYRPEAPEKCWNTGAMTFRLFGWLADRFGSFDLCYEVNDRYPQKRLTLAQLQGIGRVLAGELAKWTDSPEGQQYHRSVNERLTKHREARTQYLKNKAGGEDERSPQELLTLGF